VNMTLMMELNCEKLKLKLISTNKKLLKTQYLYHLKFNFFEIASKKSHLSRGF
jgi:hypothetical protein